MFKKLFYLTFITLLNITLGYSQVSIGNIEEPAEGALLQLKTIPNITDSSANSKKGMMLPRVDLTDNKNLFPMFLNSDGSVNSLYNSITNKTLQDINHIGLLVYNTNNCLNRKFKEGLYVWNGNEWAFLNTYSNNTEYYVDNRQQILGAQKYPYRNFGEIAGDWMLENIRYIPDDGGTTMTQDFSNETSSTASTDKFYAYPNQQIINVIPTTWSIEQGLLYTYSAATLGSKDSSSSYEANISIDNIQGVCPDGWHIPSDLEWNQLEKEIYNNPSKYSYYPETPSFNPSTWDNTWETTINFRGSSSDEGHSYVMLSSCKLLEQETKGQSFLILDGGLNFIPSGYILSGDINGYGENSSYWTASTYDINFGFSRGVVIDNQQVNRGVPRRFYQLAIRCKR